MTKIAQYRFGEGICVGDIILSTVGQSVISAAIRMGTRSPFSHVAIYRGEMNVLEAIGVGVINYSIMRRGVRSKDRVRVLRLRAEIPNRENIANAAVLSAERYRGHGYWIQGALGSIIGNKQNDAFGRMFCSYLIAQVYEEAGLKLCPEKSPRDVTPAMLLQSAVLVDVTDTVLAPIPDWQNETGGFEAIDVEQAESPAHARLAQERNLLAEINKIFFRRGLRAATTLDDVLEVLLTEATGTVQRGVDQEICALLDNRGFGQATMALNVEIVAQDLDPNTMPLSGLEATIELHRTLEEKWILRLADLEAEHNAAGEFYEQFGLGTIDRFQRDLKSRGDCLRTALDELDQECTRLELARCERNRLHNC